MIFISIGHHPKKPGACFNDFCEHDEAKIWASLIANHLGQDGMVVPVGTLRDKVAFINEYDNSNEKANIAMEIHFNSAVVEGEHVGKGSETLYYPGSAAGSMLAKDIQDVLARIFPPGRGVKEGWYRMDPSRGPDFFLARTRYPSIIIEPEFIQRKDIIQDKRDSACAGIAEALLETYEGWK